jgi:hypothetical protein
MTPLTPALAAPPPASPAASYAHGASAVPLLGETIGANLRRTVERFGDREALVVRATAPRTASSGTRPPSSRAR